MPEPLDAWIAALNGTVGNYLRRTQNGLATPMGLVHGSRPLPITREAIAQAHPGATARVALLVHGLMSTESAFRMPDGETYATLLSRDLGMTPFAVRYNSGLHISENGEALDELLEGFVAAYPVPIEEIVLIGHSMGGLVIRAASHTASEHDRRWLPRFKRAFYVGSPHLGSMYEQLGNLVVWTLGKIPDPITELIAEIGNLRSAGIKDLRFGNLRREDWDGVDLDELLRNRRHPVPLLPHVRHHVIAGTVSEASIPTLLFGDAVVPLPSATGRARPEHRCVLFPQEHVRVLPGKTHLQLAHDAEVYAQIRAWCEERIPCNDCEG